MNIIHISTNPTNIPVMRHTSIKKILTNIRIKTTNKNIIPVLRYQNQLHHQQIPIMTTIPHKIIFISQFAKTLPMC